MKWRRVRWDTGNDSIVSGPINITPYTPSLHPFLKDGLQDHLASFSIPTQEWLGGKLGKVTLTKQEQMGKKGLPLVTVPQQLNTESWSYLKSWQSAGK